MLIVGLVAASEGPDGPPVLVLYGVFGGIFVAFGVLTTAAWVLSKPVTRTFFLISRFVGNMAPILLIAVIIPGIIVYLTFGFLGDIGWINPAGFAAAVLLLDGLGANAVSDRVFAGSIGF